MKLTRKPDTFVPHFPVACHNCPNRALCEMKVAERRYEEDISIQTHVTAHLQMKCCCPRQGGKTLLGEFPENIKATKQYGTNLVAFHTFCGNWSTRRRSSTSNGQSLCENCCVKSSMMR